MNILAGANGSDPRERQLMSRAERALGRIIEEERNGFKPTLVTVGVVDSAPRSLRASETHDQKSDQVC